MSEIIKECTLLRRMALPRWLFALLPRWELVLALPRWELALLPMLEAMHPMPMQQRQPKRASIGQEVSYPHENKPASRSRLPCLDDV